MKILHFLPLLFLLFACGGDMLISDGEKKAMAKVTEFYGGECGWSKGFEYANGKNEDYFELSLSKSDLLHRYADKIEMPASNIAYLFYTNLGAEQKKYSHIRVKIDLGKEGNYENSFAAKEIKEIVQFTPYVSLMEQLAKAQDYATIWATFDEEIQRDLSEEKLRAFFQASDSACGPFGTLQFQGYRFYDSEIDSRPMVQLACVVIRSKENTPLSLFFDRKTKKLMGMNEKF